MFDSRFPVPQANCLEKVMVVVDAVSHGCRTADAVASALDVVGRQGHYYVNAAGFLGLLDVSRSSTPHEWSLTVAGEEFARLDAAGRVAFMQAVLAEVDEIVAAVDDADSVLEDMLSSGLSDSTGERRLACVNAWVDVATSPGGTLTAAVLSEQSQALARSAAAASAHPARRAEVKAAVCGQCFMTLPASGECDCAA